MKWEASIVMERKILGMGHKRGRKGAREMAKKKNGAKVVALHA